MSQKTAWITGASSGIGAAAAKRLAADGWRVAITARSEDKLNALAAENDLLKAYAGDVTDLAQMKDIVRRIELDLGHIDLVILNAGTYKHDVMSAFSAENFAHHLDINLQGVANGLEAVLPPMLERQSGHIALVASVAGYRGLPRSLSYGATKAALINMAEALAIEMLDKGIKVQVINPGFIKTPLTDKNDFPMPMLMDVDEAADKLVKGLSSNKFEITFPWAFAFLLKLAGLLPDKLYFRLVKKATAGQN